VPPAGRFSDRYGRWAVVAGGSEGLGEAFARALAARGMDLVLVARRPPPLEDLAGALRRERGVEVRTLPLDLATAGGAAALLAETEALDVGLLVCSAALSPIAPFLDLAPDALERMLDLNCRSVTVLAHAFGRRLAARGRGGIVVLSSLAGLQGSALVAHYAATKAYGRVLAEGLWAELRPRGVDVVACCVGPVRTPTFERTRPAPPRLLPLVLEPEPVVAAALAALGRRPVVIAGWLNRLAAFLTQRVLSRRAAVRWVSAGTRALYPAHRRAGSRPTEGPGGKGG
jgi:uncharacterized protein